MRRVVVTGMGIVSSIGNNTQEVTASLHDGKSGITRADRQAELGFRSQVHGAPTLRAEEVVDRRAMRFHGGGTAWSHVAMDQAIVDSGLAPDEVSNERTGIIMGSGVPRPVRSSRPPTSPERKAPNALARSRCPKPCRRPRRRLCRPGSKSRASAIRFPRPAPRPIIVSAQPTKPFSPSDRM